MRIFDSQFHSLWAYFQTGGPVMLPLLLVSLLVWVLIAHRWFYLRRLGYKVVSRREAWRAIKSGDVSAIGTGCIVGVLTCRFIEARSGEPLLDRKILDEIVSSCRKPLTHYLPLIGVLAAMTPLLGLLGTVIGMMDTFEVMSLFGTGDARGMASGISEALITTETGLIIAIPAMYMKNVLEERAQQLEQRLVSTSCYLRRHLRSEKV